MSVPQQAGSANSASTVTAETAAVDKQVEILLAAIRSDNAEGIAAAFDRLGELQGTAGMATVVSALQATGLIDAMLTVLTKHAETQRTPVAWIYLASAATAVRRDALAIDSARAALQADPTMTSAAFIMSVAANRQGEYDEALRVIADISSRVPDAKNDPHFVLQSALAEFGRNHPQDALVAIEAALERFADVGLEFDAHVLRARALGSIPESASEAVSAWERALAVAQHPVQIDQARDELIAALGRAKRYDEGVRQLDLAIAATTNAAARSSWIAARPAFLAMKGDMDGALAAWDDLLAVTTDPDHRVQLRLKQARFAATASRWKDAATHFDAALTEISTEATQTSERRQAIQLEKAQTLAPHEIDLVMTDLDELDATWNLPGWPKPIDLRVGGLLAAGRAAEALTWLDERLGRTALADHPAAHQLRGDTELKLGHTDEAMRACRRAVDLAPTAADPRALGAVLMCAFATQQWKAAVDAYDRLGQLDPVSASDPSVRVVAAVAYLRLDEFETALKLTDDAQPATLILQAMRDVCRGEAQVRLRRYDDVLATTADALKRYQALQSATPSAHVPAEFLLSIHTLRAQVFNQQEKFEDARLAASAAIDVPEEPGVVLQGLTAFVRLGAIMQRSLALYRLGKATEAQRDINNAINSFERQRNTAIVRMMEQAPEFERFESALWYAKGTLLAAERRNDEALAAYTRAERLEKQGSAAATARGYALFDTDAFKDALASFEAAVARASSPPELSDALAGKGRALVHLGQFEEAINTLQAALDVRLTEPDNDPVVFEVLGIAYNSLQRNGAANRAFRRAWTLTKEEKRKDSVNLARGVTAAELTLGDPAAALEFLDELPSTLADNRDLQFNRALALDALGRRREAIRFLVRAKDKGLDDAQKLLDRLDAPAGLGRWTHYWFGAQARRTRRAFGIALLIIAGMGLAAPLFQWWLHAKLDWYLLLLPSVVALLLLALPNMKSITFEAGRVKLSAEPLSATGQDATTGSLILPASIAFLGAATKNIDLFTAGAATLGGSGGHQPGSKLASVSVFSSVPF